jgi:hypothetical protein
MVAGEGTVDFENPLHIRADEGQTLARLALYTEKNVIKNFVSSHFLACRGHKVMVSSDALRLLHTCRFIETVIEICFCGFRAFPSHQRKRYS